MDDEQQQQKQKPKAVIVGGSIAGLSCAHALTLAGWQVVVIEKSSTPPSGTPTGAGLALDHLSQLLIHSWLQQPQLFLNASLPLFANQHQAIDSEKKVTWTLAREENDNYRLLHWAELHCLLYNALPPDIFLWGHLFLSFSISQYKTSVKVKAKVLQTNEIIEVDGNLLVAADGSQSLIRQSFLPDLKLRYSGYFAWRGLLDYSGKENPEIINGIKRVYPEIGRCLYFNLGSGTHSVLYELTNKRLNWLWYVNQPEPELKGNSVTMKVSNDMIKNMQQEAQKVWIPEFARLIKETENTFINVIYDCEPLKQIFWDNVVLIGDAAHPTTPNGGRSTIMSIVDAAVLGKCLDMWGVETLSSALNEYQSIRLPVTTEQVLHSRQMGRFKQGLNLPDRQPFDMKTASPEDCEELKMKNMPFFYSIPSILTTTLYST